MNSVCMHHSTRVDEGGKGCTLPMIKKEGMPRNGEGGKSVPCVSPDLSHERERVGGVGRIQ